MKTQIYDYSKLRGLIAEKYGTIKAFAKAMGMGAPSVSMKLHNDTYWSQPDIGKACELLGIADPREYFFTKAVKGN